MMVYGSICSGIEAATVAWEPLSFRPAWFAEIDPFCSALLAHHYPGVPNLGDFTQINSGTVPIDVLAGGTPCQSFSVAGRRGGLEDARGNLAIEFCRLAGRLRPRWVVWENVPGVLSSNGGRDFGSIVGTLAKLGYGCAWRVLDAQFLGVPQRRRRVFVVGHLGDWRRAAAVLLERQGLCRDTPARRKTRETTPADSVCGAEVGPSGGRFTDLAPTLDARCKDSAIRNQVGLLVFGGGNTSGAIDVATALTHHGTRQDFDTETFVAHTLRGDGFDASEDGSGRGTPLVPVAFSAKDYGADLGGTAPTLRAMPHERSHANAGGQVAVCVQEGQTGVREYDTAGTVRSDAPGTQPGGSLIRDGYAVRRLTPRECERLQGFEDDYTLIPYRGKLAADGPRYRAIGNSMAVPVMRWIGRRIQIVDGLCV
ncbi:MAG: DNA cytosine methyltransferase [Bryobacteraceae bacterium]|nr:DNA cytosine methyltransferase [Bryobacteraceae bacterium]